MKNKSICITSLAALAILPQANAQKTSSSKGQERPNILWLSFEDTSPYEFGCYGNRHATTPVIDSLAAIGIQFMNAYSCGPQSSPSRSTLITGCYSTTYAMDWHRGRVRTPDDVLFPQILRDAGYYCTNNKKTDYNTTLDNQSCWDECGDKASYNSTSRRPDQPFFAVFNSNLTHMSRITSTHIDGRRNFAEQGLDPAELELPPHVPDLPEVRSDYAFHIEGANDVDRWVKIFLDDLKARGLDDNTIVFVFSDHGGCLPRGKAYSYETSFRVPMVVYIPEKWQHLSKMPVGKQSGRLVSFADMGPTMLSLAGVDIPERMQGIPFLGNQDKAERKYQIGYMTNRTIHFVPSRTICDGRYKYIRYYIPYKKDNLFNYFQWQMPANLFWDKAYFEDTELPDIHKRPYEYTPCESFYDLEKDPFELNDLISDRKYARHAEKLKKELSNHLRKSKDIGLLPLTCRKGDVPYDRVRSKGYDLEELYTLAEMTASVSAGDIPHLKEVLAGDMADEFKFWAAVNMAALAIKGELTDGTEELKKILENENYMVAQEAALALCYTKEKAAGWQWFIINPAYTASLEVMSLAPEMKGEFPAQVIENLTAVSRRFEAKKRNRMPGGNDGVNERKVLVNLGLLKAEELYGPHVYEAGLSINRARRKLVPKPSVE